MINELIRAFGGVAVNTDRGAYSDTQANFEIDFGRKLPKLPKGADQMIYKQNISHAYIDSRAGNLIEGGDVPWPLGDEVIDRITYLVAAKETREKAAADEAAEVAQARVDALIPHSVKAWQLFEQLAIDGMITQQEALAAVQDRTIPGRIQKWIDRQPVATRFHHEMVWEGSDTFDWHPEIEHMTQYPLAQALGMSIDELGDFLKRAVKL